MAVRNSLGVDRPHSDSQSPLDSPGRAQQSRAGRGTCSLRLLLIPLLAIAALSTLLQLRRTRRLLSGFRNEALRSLHASLEAILPGDEESSFGLDDDELDSQTSKAISLFDAMLAAVGEDGASPRDSSSSDSPFVAASGLDATGGGSGVSDDAEVPVDPLDIELARVHAGLGWAAAQDVPWRFDPDAVAADIEAAALQELEAVEAEEREKELERAVSVTQRKTGGVAASRSASRAPRSGSPTRSNSRSPRPPPSSSASPSTEADPSMTPSRSPIIHPRRRLDSRPVASRYKCPANRRYVHLLSTREGMSAWTHIIYESLALAHHLGRVMVEPCVAGGLLLPCRPGKVLPIPRGSHETDYPITAEDDPLAVPAYKEHCAGPKGSIPRKVVLQKGRSYPLSLYMDLHALTAAFKVPVVSFEEWTECELRRRARAPGQDVRFVARRVLAPRGYCVGMRAGVKSDPFGGCKRRELGRYRFKQMWTPYDVPRGPSGKLAGFGEGHIAAHYLRDFEADSNANMFLLEVWRGFFRPYGTFKRTPRFNEIHARAVDKWVRQRLGVANGAYLTFGWRSEGVHEGKMASCASVLGQRAAPIVEALLNSRKGVGAVLVADIPATENPCRVWHTYEGSSADGGSRRIALETLADAGLVKYDADFPAIDAGVLSIRDWLLSTTSKWYVTCHDLTGADKETQEECKRCFRTQSKYLSRILTARAKAGKVSWTRWFQATPKGVVGAAQGGGAMVGASAGGKKAASQK